MTEGVSVVLATITMDDWLEQAIGSILSQDGVPVQLIVVHDGIEVDRTRSWVSDDRVTIATLPQRSGPAAAANHGVQHAQFDLVARLDSDDVAEPGRLSRQSTFLGEHPEVGLLGGSARLIDETGRRIGRLPAIASTDVRRRLLTRNALVHSSVMYRKSWFDEAGGYDPSLTQMEDYHLWMRMAQIGKIALADTDEVSYRLHTNQTTRRNAPTRAHLQTVLGERRALARQLGVSLAGQTVRDTAWLAANYARAHGVRRAGYDQAAHQHARDTSEGLQMQQQGTARR